MASSVARMPPADDWRDHGRLAVAVFGAARGRSSISTADLKSFILRQQQRQQSHAASSASASSSISNSSGALAAAAGDSAANEGGGESPATARKRQTQILDRRAAREARRMAAAIERQARKAELSTLTTDPRAAALLLLEVSPAPSDSSPGSSAVPSSSARDVRPNVRASSLIQMWRELEAEAAHSPKNRPASAGGITPDNHAAASSGVHSDGSDESDAFADWNSDSMTTASIERANSSASIERANSSASIERANSTSSSMNEAERSRVGSIVKMLSTGHGVRSSVEIEMPARESPAVAADKADKVGRLRGKGALVLSPRRLRGRGEMERFVARMEQERRRELVALTERQQVSRFAYRGRIQSMLKLRSLHRREAVQDRMRAPSRRLESNQKKIGSTISFIRERFNNQRGQDCGSSKTTLESSSSPNVQFPATTTTMMTRKDEDYPIILNVQFPINAEPEGSDFTSGVNVQFPMNAEGSDFTSSVNVQFPMDAEGSDFTSNANVQFVDAEGSDFTSSVNVQFPMDAEGSDFTSNANVQFVDAEGSDFTSSVNVQCPMDAEGSGHPCSSDQCTSCNIHYEATASPEDSVRSPVEADSQDCRSHDLQEGNQGIDGSWDDRNLWMSNLDWRGPSDSPTNGWHSEVAAEDIESSPQQIACSWIGGDDNSWRGWTVRRRPPCEDLFEFSDNAEIRDLLERRRVSTSLDSDFCAKMNQMILSLIQRQAQQQSFDEDEDYSDNHMNHPYLSPNVAFEKAEQDESISSSLVPLHYQPLQRLESWQNVPFTRQSSQNILDLEAIHDLRSEMAQIHEEISELRLMVESCIEWQTKLRQTIKQDILDALGQSAGAASSNKSSRTNTCCICCEAQVDSLLYRCGHMCTCYKCASQLQWSNGTCPICQSPIIDVVRACPNS